MKLGCGVMVGISVLSICQGQVDIPSFFDAATLRAGLRLAVEVPFNNIAINTVPDGLTFLQSSQHIFKHKGISGFYSGAFIEILRSGLWYPRMKVMENPYSIGLNIRDHDPHLLRAANLTALEVIAMPLFRLRTVLMLHPFQSVVDSAPHIAQTLYAGSFLRGSATFTSWYAFFKAQDFASTQWSKQPWVQVAFTTVTQVITGIMTAPLYVVMINRQKLTNPCKSYFLQSAWQTYLNQGAHVFIRTAKFGAFHSGIQGALTAGVMICLEK